uniref:MCM_OB domain-containing protein n=1 Tax=Ascaris lumbricoides TaxID=6252 RepID=A0A0M3HHM0_ASCLU
MEGAGTKLADGDCVIVCGVLTGEEDGRTARCDIAAFSLPLFICIRYSSAVNNIIVDWRSPSSISKPSASSIRASFASSAVRKTISACLSDGTIGSFSSRIDSMVSLPRIDESNV